jgi:hypothetical protein
VLSEIHTRVTLTFLSQDTGCEIYKKAWESGRLRGRAMLVGEKQGTQAVVAPDIFTATQLRSLHLAC